MTCKIVSHRRTTDGSEVWRIRRGGKLETLVTTAASARRMDDAAIIYADALRRLSKR